MSPSSHRRLLREQMQRATIKLRLAQAADRKAGGLAFPPIVQSPLHRIVAAIAGQANTPAPEPADEPVRH
jgi:hypothetical protein